MYKTLKYELGDDGVAVATIDVPNSGANVMGEEFREDLIALLAEVSGNERVKGLVFASAKKDFMAGGDLKAMVEMFDREMSAEEAFAIASSMNPLLRQLETCGKPVAAAISGPAMGGGLELCLACHYRVISDAPKVIVGLPEVTLGLMPGAGGTQRLPRVIGIRKALPLLLQGTPLTAQKALELGVVDAIVPAAELVDAARRWVANATAEKAVQPWDRKGYKIAGGAGFFDPEICALYNFSATTIARETNRNLPAPIGILSAVARGTAVTLDAALHIESCEFAKLVLSPVARNMVRTLFVNKGELDKLKNRPADVAPAQIATIGVLGAGLMGSGIAQVSAQAGLNVVLLDATDAQAQAGRQRIADSMAKQVQRGRMQQDKADALLARITATADYTALAPCDLIVEAVFEDRQVKAEVYRKAQAVLRRDAIIATNTSAIPVTSLAVSVENPERFIGLHFFSPVDRMPLVEVIKGEATSESTLAHALDYIKLLRKTPIIVNDAPYFFTTRVISAYMQECLGMVAEGLSPVLIDNVAKQAGFPVGPLTMADELSIELGYHATNQQRADAGANWVEPYGYKVQQKFCEELNRKGRRFGSGFYDYVDGKRQPWKGLAEIYPAPAAAPNIGEMKQRMVYIQSLEAARAFEQSVITDPVEGDVGALLGIGFPAFTGGPFSLIDTVGAAEFVAACDRLADKYGERFRPTSGLRERAASGVRFYPRKVS